MINVENKKENRKGEIYIALLLKMKLEIPFYLQRTLCQQAEHHEGTINKAMSGSFSGFMPEGYRGVPMTPLDPYPLPLVIEPAHVPITLPCHNELCKLM